VRHFLSWLLTGAGLAGITPAAGYVSVQASCIIGLAIGVASFYGPMLVRRVLKIDDALDVRLASIVP
jgi:Amt family ammonium transporter